MGTSTDGSWGDGADATGAMLAAADQIAMAANESQAGVGEIASALQNLSSLLVDVRSGTASPEAVAILREELARAVVSLQYHDRMVQHLSHVGRYLTQAAMQVKSGGTASNVSWELLHRSLSGEPSRGEVELF